MLSLFSVVPQGRLYAQSEDTLLTETAAVPDPAAPGIPVPADSTGSQSITPVSKADTAATDSADTTLPAKEPVFVNDTATAESAVSTAEAAVPPVDTAAVIQDSVPSNSLQSPQKPSGYYQGYNPVNRGVRRGISTPGTSAKVGRKLLQTADPVPAAILDTSALSQGSDTIPHAAAADATAGIQATGSTTPPSAVTPASKRAKIITAAGTTAAVIGVTTFILVKKYSEENSRKNEGIPDPPGPPGYW